mmetsp:Transcript_19490/g.22573  ORF Transcript_19490/g.22573 Transcript_19490/m.22573 type:complete len:234 (+) Transcript_19490:107-808(+)
MSSKENDKKRSVAPDAMDQTIYEMLTNTDNRELSKQISSMYSPQSVLHRPVTIPTNNGNKPIKSNIPYYSQFMPYPVPWRLSQGPDEVPADFSWLTDSCSGKAAVGVFGGAAMGLVMGVFLGAMSDMTPPVTVINGKEVPQAPLKEQMRTTLRATGEKSLYWARNFAFITGVFGGSDCLVEKYRGTHDVWNSVVSGCVTGAAMQAKSGPQASAVGCAGFAAFSLVIDKVMGTH